MAQMTAAAINDLPDSAFAYIEPGGKKDSTGRTTPREKRHFPVHDAAHVRNALARIAQGAEFGQQALPKVKAAAARFGIQVNADGRAMDDPAEPERRYTPGLVEVRALPDGVNRIAGYASVFNRLSRNLGGFVERVGTGAFNQSRTLGWPNVVCRYNHDSSMILGTTAGHTLSLRTDDMGLWYEVDPPKARADIVELVQRGDVQHSSFAFRVVSDRWALTDQDYPMRTLQEVELVDVAPVLDPAYPDATAGLRSLAMTMEAPLEDVLTLAQDNELRRFFIRTDRTAKGGKAQKPARKRISGAKALLDLMERRFDPALEEDAEDL